MEKLDCKSLMVGDWVKNRLDYGTISAILKYDRVIVHSGIWDTETSAQGLEPIPLTPEILEKNGFAKISPQDTWLYRPLDKYVDKFLYAIRARRFDYPIYRIDIDNYVFRTGMGFSGQLQYVHELQHALRLCGIDLDIKL